MLYFKTVSMRGFAFTASILFALIFFPCAMAICADSSGKKFDSLQQSLVKDGFDPERLKALYGRSDVFFDTGTVARFFVHSEARLNYDQFAGRRLIAKAKKYMLDYRGELENVEKQYGVDSEIITAILLVETKLGTYLGRSQILSTLSTMAALTDPGLRNELWVKIPSNRRITRQKFEKKADRRSTWAYRELKALLTYADRERLDPAAIHGSYAGAMGICQFMPSNIIAYARDGNGDEKIDLFDHADAIASAASYLKHYGWHPGIDEKKAFKVIRKYNHSDPYVKTILKIATLLKD
ncbi:MAG: lytic murein transglycosylase [Deltaproteobacteria bacterium]|nr:lytic murein transglycosylase [Deltaproteobacteria bacterium]